MHCFERWARESLAAVREPQYRPVSIALSKYNENYLRKAAKVETFVEGGPTKFAYFAKLSRFAFPQRRSKQRIWHRC